MFSTALTNINPKEEDFLAEWDTLVADSPFGTVYHSSTWLNALYEGMGQPIDCLHVSDDEGILAGAAICRRKKLGIALARKPWGTAYNGIFSRQSCPPCAIDEILQFISHQYAYVRLVQAPSAAYDMSSGNSWNIVTQQTPILDISDCDTLWKSFDRRVRQRVRKATDLGIKIAITNDYAAFFKLYQMTYRRQDLDMPINLHDFCNTIEIACSQGTIQLYMARTEKDEPAAALLVGKDPRRAYFMLAASHTEHRKTDAVSLLWWHVMQELSESHTEIDLVGIGTEGIDKFKRSFRPTPTDFLDQSCYSSHITEVLLKGGEKLKSYLRSLRQEGFSKKKLS